jgi:hypothetical protein
MNRMHMLMNSIEDKTGMMLHEFDKELFDKCEKAGASQSYSKAIASLAKTLDKLA